MVKSNRQRQDKTAHIKYVNGKDSLVGVLPNPVYERVEQYFHFLKIKGAE
jgi:hypothetical protein